MKKLIIIMIVSVILVFILFFISINILESEYDKHKNRVQQNMGKKVILNNDTLLVVDYSIIENHYTLSNGVKVDLELIEQIKIK